LERQEQKTFVASGTVDNDLTKLERAIGDLIRYLLTT